MKLAVVRHGETIENAHDIVMGHHGGTLSHKGIEQAKAVTLTLKDEKFNQVWSSDLQRCVDTAKYILQLHPDLELKLTPALREVNYGKFQGRPGAEIRAYFDEQGGFTQESKAPDGESHLEMGKRVLHFVNGLLEQFPEERILIVSHNGPIEVIRASVEQTPFSGDAKNAGIWKGEVNEPLRPYVEERTENT